MSAVLNLSRSVGLITGASLVGSVFAGASAWLEPTAAGAETASAMRVTFTLATVWSAAALALLTGRMRPPRGS